MSEWPFAKGEKVIGLPLLKMIDWVDESRKTLEPREHPTDSLPPNDKPIIALPPIQRSAVWRPKQVVDLWNSLMRGLPIGLFYLVKQSNGQRTVTTYTGKTEETDLPGYDLLDGQQRIRALLLGATGFSEEKRCLWVDLSKVEESELPVLRITSKGQPFGYDANTGNKLSLEERQRARKRIEGEDVQFQLKERRAYDRELFDEEEVTHNGKRIDPQPPLPYGGDPQHVFKLSDLLSAWRKEGRHSSEEGVAALRSITGDGTRQESLSCLHKAFERVRSAEVALLCVDPKTFHNENKDFPQLFDRIGAGGTPLVGDERLYSIYKYHWPHIRDAVNSIYDQAGHVLSPAKIAATGIRIVYAQTSKDRNDLPDVASFSRMMLDGQSEDFQAHLKRLIPPSDWEQNQHVTLLSSFKTVKGLLVRGEGVGHFWLPDVMLASLPAELWQVLLFWAVRHPKLETVNQSREEVVRFALFWYLCVFNNEKAARWAFTDIKKFTENVDFPGKALYRLFIGDGADHCAHELITPKEFEKKLCKEESSSSSWRSDADRFVANGTRDHLLFDWWYGGRKMLPWLQRDYIQCSFPQYVPLADHEDDLPYDVDHLCPIKDWGDDRRNLKKRLDGLDQILENKVYDCKGVMGNGIGNLRLVESSQNRKHQDIDVADKMPFILCDDQPSQEGYAKAMAESAFAPDHREVWKRVARPGQGVADRKWNMERLNAFQRAVERRAAWLYERFHDDLGYGQWTNGT